MTQPVQSDGVGLSLVPEATLATQPTTGWLLAQPNPDGIKKFARQNIVVERHILSPNLTPERGEVVGYDVVPQLIHDWTRDLIGFIREPTFRSATKHSGGSGTSLFRPSAIAAAAITVPSGGALPQNVLVRGQGCTNAGNNAIFVVGVGSTATSIVISGGTTEASPPPNAIFEVAGVQGTTGDIALNASGNLTSTALDFTTLGLNPEQEIYVGDPTSGAAFAFATAAYTGMAVIVSVAPHLITLKRRAWTVGSADTGAGQTIRLLFTRMIQNVPIDPTGANGYLISPSLSFEKSEPGAGGGTDYTYVNGCGVGKLQLDIPVESKVTATIDLVGMVCGSPTSARATGPSTAYAPNLASVFTTAANMPDIRLLKQSDESRVSTEINKLVLAFSNNLKPRKQLGTAGAAGLVFGEYQPTLTMDAYVLDNNMTKDVDGNVDLTLDFLLKNANGGCGFNLPMVKLRKGEKSYRAGESVMLAGDIQANRDPSTGVLWAMSEFAYLP